MYIPDVSRVESMTILGVQFNQVLSFASHVIQAVVGKVARSMYALKLYGTLNELPSFHNYNFLVQLAWSGFLSGFECSRLPAIINKAVRYGLPPTHFPSASDLLQSADQSLFRSVIRNPHARSSSTTPTRYKLKTNYYDLNHINIYCQPYPPLSQKSFINRML